MISFGGSKSKQKSQSNQQSTSQSGTEFNEEFLNKALSYFGNPNAAVKKRLAELPALEAEYADISSRGPNAFLDQPYAMDLAERIKKIKELQGQPEITTPDYNPQYVRSGFTPGAFTPVEGGDFDRIEQNLYGSQQSKLKQAYDQAVARQREELSQMGGLNSPTQFLEGSARSSMDRGYLDNLQQAARDASTTALGLKAGEAARRTGFDVGEATRRTGFETGEAGRETQFNEQTAARVLELWLKKLAMAIESGRFSIGQSTGQSQGSGSNVGGNFGILSSGGGSGGSSDSWFD